jgi:hypothetical protein
MKKPSFLAAAALVALGTSVATAQDTTRKEAKGDVMKPVTVASLVTIVDASLATAGKVAALKPETPPALEIVDVKPFIATEADQKIVKEALDKNKDSIKQLEDTLKANTTIKAALDNHPGKPDAGDIVGAEMPDGNKLIIYFWKK